MKASVSKRRLGLLLKLFLVSAESDKTRHATVAWEGDSRDVPSDFPDSKRSADVFFTSAAL